MKLIFYSGGQSLKNQRLHKAAINLALDGQKHKKLRFTYIPFCYDGSGEYFRRAIRRYQAHGISEFYCLPIDRTISKKNLEAALASDIIYLAGGNTYYFLKHIRSQGLIPILKKFSKKGGVIAGLSAGALIMTPNINLAAIPDFEADENEVGLKNLNSLGLVDFEFSPHFCDSRKFTKALKDYSMKNKNRKIFAAKDGAGLVVSGKSLIAIGDVRVFYKGDTYKFF